MIRRQFRALAEDRSGLALIEFAMVLPVLIMLFFGGYQLLDASACKRRVTITARAIADLTSQFEAVDTADLDRILTASTQIMTPYDASNATVRVTEITVSPAAQPKVTWSRAQRTTALTPGSAFAALPAAMRIPGASYIYAEVSYDYDNNLGSYVPAISFKQTLLMLPRKSLSVDCSSCPTS